ncbi:hypothetical protein Lal_00033397 [Lupinus albus]|nr:hypothetical protein Lal_00033397 [Lupinus albus]
MTHKFCFEALDISLADIMGTTTNESIIFGGKGVVFGGNFRKILTVVTRGYRSNIVHVGDGKLFEPNDGSNEVYIPEELLILDFDNSIEAIVSNTSLNLQDRYNDEEFLQYRAIFALTIKIVEQVNEYVLNIIPNCEHPILSGLF